MYDVWLSYVCHTLGCKLNLNVTDNIENKIINSANSAASLWIQPSQSRT